MYDEIFQQHMIFFSYIKEEIGAKQLVMDGKIIIFVIIINIITVIIIIIIIYNSYSQYYHF